jgi:SAM-dependent methyltransferase
MVLEIADFGRLQLADLIHELDFQVAVEVGVAGGWYSNQIMQRNPQLKLYGVDPWVPYRGYNDYTRTSTFSKLEDSAHDLLDKYPNYEFIKEFSVDALKRFEDNSLDFVFIDANHGDPYVTQDITNWYKKVRPGGILAGHDYTRSAGKNGGPPPKNDTINAVNKFAKDNNLVLFVLGTKTIREGEIRDKVRSWMIKK